MERPIFIIKHTKDATLFTKENEQIIDWVLHMQPLVYPCHLNN
jgi:hypothetical protein